MTPYTICARPTGDGYPCRRRAGHDMECDPTPRASDAEAPAPDLINHPPHYTSHPSGVECIAVTEHFVFNIGNAIKYLWRAGLKGDAVADLRKAAWYVHREIARLERRADS